MLIYSNNDYSQRICIYKIISLYPHLSHYIFAYNDFQEMQVVKRSKLPLKRIETMHYWQKVLSFASRYAWKVSKLHIAIFVDLLLAWLILFILCVMSFLFMFYIVYKKEKLYNDTFYLSSFMTPECFFLHLPYYFLAGPALNLWCFVCFIIV